MNKHKPHILCLGEWGFPLGFGAIQRMQLIARGLLHQGCKVTVICFKGSHSAAHNFPPVGLYNGIHYRYTSGTIHKPSSFFRRNWLKLVGKVNELNYIWQLKKRGELGGCLVSTMHIDLLIIYWVWFKIIRVPLILNYDEMVSAIASRSGWERINDRLFDRLAVPLSDGVCPISEYLIEHTRRYSKKKPLLKLPILCDFEKFKVKESVNDGVIFLYAGAASYLPLVRFILQSFDLLDPPQNVYLDLVLGGEENDLNRAKEVISNSRNSKMVRLYANVAHELIPDYYANASALLIPLRPTIQDAARFPHKIGEYLASGRVVITTNYGEIKYYDFIDQQTALVASTFDQKDFSHKMKYIIDHKKHAMEIGLRGREMGLKNFNYINIGGQVKDFILRLNK
ncbi:MAG: glycosyltransferase [Cyclobacteriaceae bacterium]